MSAHASQAFSIAHCTDSEDLPLRLMMMMMIAEDVKVFGRCGVLMFSVTSVCVSVCLSAVL